MSFISDMLSSFGTNRTTVLGIELKAKLEEIKSMRDGIVSATKKANEPVILDAKSNQVQTPWYRGF